MTMTVTYGLTPVKDAFVANVDHNAGNQLLPDVQGLSGGGFVVAYNNVSDESGFMLLNFYNSAYTPLEGPDVPYDTLGMAPFTQATLAPTLTELHSGNVLVVWDDNLAGDAGLRGRIFTQAGVAVGGELDLLDGTNSGQAANAVYDPEISALPDGGFLAAYTLYRGDHTYPFVARFNAAGALVTNVELPVDGVIQNATDPDVTALVGGGWVVTYCGSYGENPVTEASHDIRAVIYNADGSIRQHDFEVVGTGIYEKLFNPKTVALPNGSYAMVFSDEDDGISNQTYYGVQLQIRDVNGNLTNSHRVNVLSDRIDEYDPDVTVLDNGMIMVTWIRDIGSDHTDIRGRLYDQAGNPVTVNGDVDEFLVRGLGTHDANAHDHTPSISSLKDGRFVVSWRDDRSATDDTSGTHITTQVNEMSRIAIGDGANDTFTGDGLKDDAQGGGGNDTLSGMGNSDTLAGGADNDSLFGGDGNDALDGGEGNDTLDGGTGTNTLVGGGGDDTFVLKSTHVVRVGQFFLTTYDAVTEASAGGSDTVKVTSAGTGFLLPTGYTLPDNVEKGVIQGADVFNLTGNALANELSGSGGANILDGGAGLDTLKGGGGNDTYILASVSGVPLSNRHYDAVVENSGGGTDTVRVTGVTKGPSYTMTANLENGEVLGSVRVTLKGNAEANQLTGHGHGHLFGMGGDDTYFASSGDTVDETGGSGTDTVESAATFSLADGTMAVGDIERLTLTGAAAADATGNGLHNVLKGNGAANALDGKAGADLLKGGLGNDTYVIDNSGDVADETGGGGIDAVKASISFSLADPDHAKGDIEDLTLTGSAKAGTGNALANTLRGNGADNVLDGKGGADLMKGGLGNDAYIVTGAGDVADEAGGGGSDTVRASISFSLADLVHAKGDIEDLTLTGVAVAGTGNGLANMLTGNKAANTLSGGAGKDHLLGGSGADVLDGGAGADKLAGGRGADSMTAGTGDAKDVFTFTSKHDSGHGAAGTWDHIFGFDNKTGNEAAYDRIDLSEIDADKGQKHDQAFRFVDHFAKAEGGKPDGEVTVKAAGQNIKVLVDVNGDKDADMIILVMHVDQLHKADFIL